MTTLVILLLGGGAVLILSAIESNADGSDVSIIQTIQDIWNDKVHVKQGTTPSSNTSSGATSGTGPGVGSYVPLSRQVIRPPDPATVAAFRAQFQRNRRVA